MNKLLFQKVFSEERTQKYFNRHADEVKAIRHYQANIRLSESFYPLLSIFEVALRNSLNRELTKMYGRPDWYLEFNKSPELANLVREITNAHQHITRRNEKASAPKVIAELTLGFWVRLLNTEYELVLWHDLRRAFPLLPKVQRKRKTVSSPLNSIRNFRNRVYHNEPVSWQFQALDDIHQEIYLVLGWLDDGLPAFAQSVDRFPTVLLDVKKKLK